ncbi:hypothetical protein PC112_g22716 [Phytophthora cactorum]|nr:hypothetical protein PC112_g22716 [Phytophthora cactorum]
MKDGAWLESDSEDVKKLKKGEKTVAIEALTSEEKELQGESGLQKVLTGMPKPSTDQIHVLVVVPEQAQPQMGLWLVNGSIENAKNTKGIRCRLYRLVASYLGYYDPARRTGDKDNALWYEDKTLRIHSLFETSKFAHLVAACSVAWVD